MIAEGDKVVCANVEHGRPDTGDPETDAVLEDRPDILERSRRLEEVRKSSSQKVAAKYGMKP
jgi:hypothetical protein